MKINFFTPLYSDQKVEPNKMFWLELVDSYFYIKGKKAKITHLNPQTKKGEVVLEEGRASFTALKVASYLTIVIPAIMLIAKYALRSKYQFTVISQKKSSFENHPKTQTEKSSYSMTSKANNMFLNTLQHPNLISSGTSPQNKENKEEKLVQNLKEPISLDSPPDIKPVQIPESSIISLPESLRIRDYSGDLDSSEKSELLVDSSDLNALKIIFQGSPKFHVTVRRQDLFLSEAKVIVNAANTHLGGGGGIDGAIHSKGGSEYAKGHKELQTAYKSNYISGYAEMIPSGELNSNHQIDSVIVVAGPAGNTRKKKEDQLYSCYYNSLLLANSQHKTSIAFPSISTGIYAFPQERAAAISLKAIYDFIKSYPDSQLTTISIHFLPNSEGLCLNLYQKAVN